MILTHASNPKTERLTPQTAAKLRECDEVTYYHESGWHCLTGWIGNRAHVRVHADYYDQVKGFIS